MDCFNYSADWCRDSESRCSECPIRALDMVAPEVGAQVLGMIDEFGLDAAVSAVNAPGASRVSRAFERLVDITGNGIQRHNGGDFSGYELAISAIKGIASIHERSCF